MTPETPDKVVHFVLTSREDAKKVLDHMIDIIKKYECASLEDLHDLIGLPSTYKDHEVGWTSLTNVEILEIKDGFVIDLPPAEPLR